MAEVHRRFTWEGNIGILEAAIQGVEADMIEILCPKGICTPMEYHFPVQPGQSAIEALSKQVLPQCQHGTRVAPK